jgi:hypothetical protein
VRTRQDGRSKVDDEKAYKSGDRRLEEEEAEIYCGESNKTV